MSEFVIYVFTVMYLHQYYSWVCMSAFMCCPNVHVHERVEQANTKVQYDMSQRHWDGWIRNILDPQQIVRVQLSEVWVFWNG
jgi:hypothetical protein